MLDELGTEGSLVLLVGAAEVLELDEEAGGVVELDEAGDVVLVEVDEEAGGVVELVEGGAEDEAGGGVVRVLDGLVVGSGELVVTEALVVTTAEVLPL